MAEFQETVRQWARMCEVTQRENEAAGYSDCSGCFLSDICCGLMPMKILEVATVEKFVMSWAAEHPEPVYPTWGEWLESEGICFSRLTNYEKVHGFTIPKVFEYQIDGKTAFICGDRVNSPIPADIAQKLGIEPKEGV